MEKTFLSILLSTTKNTNNAIPPPSQTIHQTQTANLTPFVGQTNSGPVAKIGPNVPKNCDKPMNKARYFLASIHYETNKQTSQKKRQNP